MGAMSNFLDRLVIGHWRMWQLAGFVAHGGEEI